MSWVIKRFLKVLSVGSLQVIGIIYLLQFWNLISTDSAPSTSGLTVLGYLMASIMYMGIGALFFEDC